MRLILVRHGESEWNREGRVLGRADIPLSELGRGQAYTVAKALQRESIRAAYSSPLKRAMATGRIISKNQGCPLIPDPDLKERGRGNLEGMLRDEALRLYPDLPQTWPEVSDVSCLHGQESLTQLDLRVRRCLDRIRARHPTETVALVGHYFVNLMVILAVLGMNPRCFVSFGQDIAAISIVEIDADRSSIRVWNDTCHLR